VGLPELRSGRYPAADATDEIIIGESGAAALGVGVGGTYAFAGKPFRVVGIFHSQDTWQDGGAFAPLSTVQALAKKPGLLTAIYVGVKPGHDRAAVAADIVAAAPQLTAISEVSQLGEVDQGVELMDAANLAISVLAVVIGAIGVMNTMVMSVFERTREIGILRAIGWRGSRILRLILGESLVLCVAAAGVGVGLGVLAVWAVQQLPAIENLLEPRYSAEVFVRALAVAVGVALVGAAYPSFRAVRLTPMEALRHE
jgi:putative ABC transport system permease protein